VADSIVVVDTGSVDFSARIASRHGAKVYYHSWQDSFSEARNYGLNFVYTDWVLCLDADEKLDERSLREHAELLSNPEIGGIRLKIINTLSEENGIESEHRYPRLFRNTGTIQFTGRIHEQISESILNSGFEIADSEITIYHNGYHEVTEEKLRRNDALLKAELDESPDDEYTRYHAGLNAFVAGNLDESKKFLHPLLTSTTLGTEQHEVIRIRCAQIALSNDDFLSVERLCDFHSVDESREGLRLFVLAAAYCANRNFAEALRCLEDTSTSSSTLVNQAVRQSTIDSIGRLQRMV
jgi:glycosyltransferase involved in cell wall biosynthesis